MKSVSAVVIVLSVVLHLTSASSGVPVLMWGNDGVTNRLPVPLAGHTLQLDAFRQNYLDSIMPCKGCNGHNVIVFLREKLSLDDVTQFGDVYNQQSQGGSFTNLKSMLERDESLALTSVSNVAENIDYLKSQFGNNVHVLDSLSEVERVPFNKESRLVLVHLNDDHSLPIEKRLAANDELVGSVVQNLEKRSVPYTALFTGQRSSHHDQEANTLMGASSRHLLAEAEPQGVGVNITDCFLMYYTGLNLTTSKANSSLAQGTAIRITGEPSTEGSTCNTTGASITLTWPVSGQSFTSLTVKMEIEPTKSPSWCVTNMTVTFGDENDVDMYAKSLEAPMKFSYACGKAVIQDTRNNKEDNIYLTFIGFQMQALLLDDGKFGYPNDCTPFFDIPILSGLIISFILIAILSFGMIMVASITTMDRFDDPKSKPLSINVQEK